MSDITENERSLLVVVNLSTGGVEKFQPIYKWLDENAMTLARLILKKQYRLIDTLSDDEVTSTNFIEKIKKLAKDPQTKALDVILSLHGLKQKLYFDDGPIESRDLGNQLKVANLKDTLRLLYSGACYGSTHAGDFIDGGFRVASGAKKVASNGPFDFPLQLHNWAKGKTYEDAVKAGNLKIGIDISDAAARALGFEDVNSRKEVFGDEKTRITSKAS